MLRPCATAIALVCLSSPLAAAGGETRELLFLDGEGDPVDGAELVQTLEVYLADSEVGVARRALAEPPLDHEGWVELAEQTAERRRPLAVLWIEPIGERLRWRVYLMLLESSSGGLIVLPIEFEQRRGTTALRVLAATVRTVLDAEMLSDLRRAGRVARADPPPPPKKRAAPPPPSAEEPRPRPLPRSDRRERATCLRLEYVGDLSLPPLAVLQGARLGALLGWSRRFGLLLDLGLTTRGELRAGGARVRELRIPLRLGFAGLASLGAVGLLLSAYWVIEPTVVEAELVEDSDAEPIEPLLRFDTGGGLELRARIGPWREVGFTLAIFAQAMAVSHRYERAGRTAIAPSDLRLGWSAGVYLPGL
ncbi:MAG: hypothetical protein R6V85_20610 [Polyangia bacterium]